MTPDYSVDAALKKDGFVRHRFNGKTCTWIQSDDGYYSSMGDIDFKWVKGDVVVYNGLNGTSVFINGITTIYLR